MGLVTGFDFKISKKQTSTCSSPFDYSFKKTSEPVTVIAPEAVTASDGAYCDSIESDVAVQSETLVILFDGDASLR